MSIAFRDLPVYDLTGATRNFEQLVALKLTGSLEGTLDEPILKKPEAFKAVSFENSWKNTAGGEPAKFMKDPFGFVHVRGLIESGESGKVAFTLPVGYRPLARAEFAAVGSGPTIASIQVATTGTVTPFGTPAISLDTVSFSVE